MKKLFALLMVAVMVMCMLAGCGGKTGGDDAKAPAGEDDTVVNLMDMYTIKDPEDVEYDQRVVLYMPVLEGSGDYDKGIRNVFSVLYGKDDKGVFMYDVEIFDSEASANAFKEGAGEGTVDGTAYISETGSAFFIAMEEFMPNLQAWIDSLAQAGYIDLD